MRQHDELELLRSRIGFIRYAIIGAIAVLVLGFWQHQIVQSEYWGGLAKKNFIRDIALVAPRGRIYDRERRLLADNRPSSNIVLIRENSPHTIEETAALLAPGIDMSVEDLLERIDRRKNEHRFRPIILKEDVSIADITFVKAHRLELREISIEEQPRRHYVDNELAAHAIGYIGEITPQEIAAGNFSGAASGDQVGKFGLERFYDSVLRGKDGSRRVIVNIQNREMGQIESTDAVRGQDVVTTLDLDLQRAAEAAIGDRIAAVVALDPRTGEILALVSKPAFDPNLFATRISSANWNRLRTDEANPMQNRVIQSHYPPGSVFKVFLAAAALEAETLTPLDQVSCSGSAVFFGRPFGCWKHEGHGVTGLHEAIVDSCDVFFYNVGNKLGIDRIASYSMMMGLGRKSGVDLPGETAGLIPTPAWKERVWKTKWYAGETISVSIGQGAVLVSPLQAAWAMGGLASGGRLLQPHLVSPAYLTGLGFNANEVQTQEYPMHQSTVDLVVSGMWGVVNEGGTGTVARIAGFDVAGKTGTAQVVGKESKAKGALTGDHAWFVGFAPYRNPEIVVAAFIENGGHGGSAAAPVAHAIMETYYRKKTGQFNSGEVAKIVDLKN